MSRPVLKDFTQEEIQANLEKIKAYYELIHANIPDFIMTDEEMLALASDKNRHALHQQAKEIHQKNKSQSEHFKRDFPDNHVDASLARMLHTLYNDDGTPEAKQQNQQFIDHMSGFSQEDIDVQTQCTRDIVQEVLDFDTKEYDVHNPEKLFDVLEQDSSRGYRLFEAQKCAGSLLEKYEVDGIDMDQFQERCKSVAGVGGYAHSMIELYMQDASLYFPMEKLTTEQTSLLIDNLTTGDYLKNNPVANELYELARIRFPMSETSLSEISPTGITLHVEQMKPGEKIANRSTHFESYHSSFKTCIRGYSKIESSLSRSDRRFYHDWMQVEQQFAHAIYDPQTCDINKLTNDYIRLYTKGNAEYKRLHASKKTDSPSYGIYQAFGEPLDPQKFAKRMETALQEQVSKNQRIPKEFHSIDKQQYIDDFQRLAKDLSRADNLFTRPKDKAYREFARALGQSSDILKKLEGYSLSTEMVNEHLKSVYDKANAYIQSCKDLKALDSRQFNRLKAANRVMDYVEFSRQRENNPNEKNLNDMLAEKLVNAQAEEFILNGNTLGTKLMLNRETRRDAKNVFLEDPAFSKLLSQVKERQHFKDDISVQEYLLKSKGNTLYKEYKFATKTLQREAKQAQEAKIKDDIEANVQLGNDWNKQALKDVALSSARPGMGQKDNKLHNLYRFANDGLTNIITEINNAEINHSFNSKSLEDGHAFAKLIAFEIIHAEREKENGPDYLNDKNINSNSLKKGPLEKQLETVGSKAFYSAVLQSDLIQNMMGKKFTLQGVKDFIQPENRATLAKVFVENQPMKAKLLEDTLKVKKVPNTEQKAVVKNENSKGKESVNKNTLQKV